MAARRYGTWCIPEAPPPSHQEKFTPVKYFSIDRVFRNETLDATHLAEFHQIEGVVADRGLTLGDLMGILHAFFTKLGEGGGAHAAVGELDTIGVAADCNVFLPHLTKVLLIAVCLPSLGLLGFLFQESQSSASSPPTTRTQSPAWRCSATMKVEVTTLHSVFPSGPIDESSSWMDAVWKPYTS